MRSKSFREWLQDKWYEHLDELEAWNQSVNYSLPQYFNRYRWWLKREYRHYQNSKT